MDRVAAQTLRVLGIVAVSIVVIVSSLIFVIATMCGLWSSTATADETLKLVLGIGCPAILIGGIFVIAKLAKGIARTRREAYAAAAGGAPIGAVPPQARDFAGEEEPLLHFRIAVGARILLSAATVTYQRVQQSSSPNGPYLRQVLIAAVIGFLLYEAPNGFVLWRIRERLERFAVLLGVAYAGVSILWTMWNFTVYMRFARFSHDPRMLALWVLPLAAEAAIVITGWRARIVLPRRADDDSTLAAAGGIAFVYTFLAYAVTNLFYRMRPF